MGNLVIPDKIEGLPVTVIDWYAFENCYNLKSVTIPDTVTHISRFAFAHCTVLETVNMPKSLYSIEQYAFFNCPKLKGINLPENLAVIEQRAFSGCKSITEITIPKACTSVGEYAFLNCDSLNTITVNGENTIFDTRSIGYSYNNGYGIKSGFSIDSVNGTAVAYAKENNIRLKSNIIKGDVNADSQFTIADLVMLEKFLLGAGTLTDWQAGDLCNDGKIDVFDMIKMRKMIVETI